MNQHYTRRRVLALTGSTAFVGLAGCGGQASEGDAPDGTDPETTDDVATPTVTETATADPSTDDQGTPTEVRMITDGKGSYFDPIGLLVEPGTTVTFVNESGSHASAAYHPDTDTTLRIPESAESWESPLYGESGKTFEVTLETEGVYDFFCPPHESLGMVGRFVVGSPQGGPGTTDPSDMPPSARENIPSVEAVVDNEVVPGP